MSSTQRSLGRRFACFAAMALGASACKDTAQARGTPAETPAVALRADNVAVTAVREISNGPSISGTLIAQRQATLRAEVAGAVTQVLVEQGQPVKAGQVLVRLDDAAIRDAELSARSQVRTANEALVVARRNAERSERLSQAGALAERDLEQARWSVTNAEGALADASSRLANAGKQLEKTAIRAP
ncbi:MAG TPA: efflux RND transporter periplasmic adaptor subunit, partial [Gemmatimonadales bacterium]|nr:efflux RND transporter periplasmic adaptor subunit [Gemmatimonadales bacterium]